MSPTKSNSGICKVCFKIERFTRGISDLDLACKPVRMAPARVKQSKARIKVRYVNIALASGLTQILIQSFLALPLVNQPSSFITRLEQRHSLACFGSGRGVRPDNVCLSCAGKEIGIEVKARSVLARAWTNFGKMSFLYH